MRAYFYEGRRTPVVAPNAKEAAKRKRRGGKLNYSRPLTASERKATRAGRWIRSRPKGFKASMRGKGPKPKASRKRRRR